MALGATRRNVLAALVLRDGATLAAIGTAIGLAIAFAGAHLLRSLVYGVAPRDAVDLRGRGRRRDGAGGGGELAAGAPRLGHRPERDAALGVGRGDRSERSAPREAPEPRSLFFQDGTSSPDRPPRIRGRALEAHGAGEAGRAALPAAGAGGGLGAEASASASGPLRSPAPAPRSPPGDRAALKRQSRRDSRPSQHSTRGTSPGPALFEETEEASR